MVTWQAPRPTVVSPSSLRGRYTLQVSPPQEAPSRLSRLQNLQESLLAATAAAAVGGLGAVLLLVIPGIADIGRGIPDIVHLLTLGTLAIGMVFIQGALYLVTGALAVLLCGLGITASALLIRRPGPWRVAGVGGIALCLLTAIGGLASLLL